MNNTYLKAAIEILTMPGGPSKDAIRTAITALEAQLEGMPDPDPELDILPTSA